VWYFEFKFDLFYLFMVFGHLRLRLEDRGWWKILGTGYIEGIILRKETVEKLQMVSHWESDSRRNKCYANVLFF